MRRAKAALNGRVMTTVGRRRVNISSAGLVHTGPGLILAGSSSS